MNLSDAAIQRQRNKEMKMDNLIKQAHELINKIALTSIENGINKKNIELKGILDALNDGEALGFFGVNESTVVEEADLIVKNWLATGMTKFNEII